MQDLYEDWNNGVEKYISGNYAGAEKSFQRIARSSKIAFNIGATRLFQLRFLEAAESFQEALQYDSSLAIAMFQKGVCHLMLGDYNAAVSSWKSTLDMIAMGEFIDYTSLHMSFILTKSEVSLNIAIAYYHAGNRELIEPYLITAKSYSTKKDDIDGYAERMEIEGDIYPCSIDDHLLFGPPSIPQALKYAITLFNYKDLKSTMIPAPNLYQKPKTNKLKSLGKSAKSLLAVGSTSRKSAPPNTSATTICNYSASPQIISEAGGQAGSSQFSKLGFESHRGKPLPMPLDGSKGPMDKGVPIADFHRRTLPGSDPSKESSNTSDGLQASRLLAPHQKPLSVAVSLDTMHIGDQSIVQDDLCLESGDQVAVDREPKLATAQSPPAWRDRAPHLQPGSYGLHHQSLNVQPSQLEAALRGDNRVHLPKTHSPPKVAAASGVQVSVESGTAHKSPESSPVDGSPETAVRTFESRRTTFGAKTAASTQLAERITERLSRPPEAAQTVMGSAKVTSPPQMSETVAPDKVTPASHQPLRVLVSYKAHNRKGNVHANTAAELRRQVLNMYDIGADDSSNVVIQYFDPEFDAFVDLDDDCEISSLDRPVRLKIARWDPE